MELHLGECMATKPEVCIGIHMKLLALFGRTQPYKGIESRTGHRAAPHMPLR